MKKLFEQVNKPTSDRYKQQYIIEEGILKRKYDGQELPGSRRDMRCQKSQTRMKELYDQKAKGREFKRGDRVMVLAPSVKSPFEARFNGLHIILEKIDDQNYQVNISGKRNRAQICHLNRLKKIFRT